MIEYMVFMVKLSGCILVSGIPIIAAILIIGASLTAWDTKTTK